MLEGGAGIEGRSVAYVAAFGVGNDELVRIIGAYMVDGHLQLTQTVGAEALKESEVRFIGHAIGGGGVDNSPAELKQGILLFEQMGGNFLNVGVKADAEK